jgi:hypothetical protein
LLMPEFLPQVRAFCVIFFHSHLPEFDFCAIPC